MYDDTSSEICLFHLMTREIIIAGFEKVRRVPETGLSIGILATNAKIYVQNRSPKPSIVAHSRTRYEYELGCAGRLEDTPKTAIRSSFLEIIQYDCTT